MITPIVKFSLGISSFQHFNELTCTNGKGSSQDSALNLIDKDKDKDEITVSMNKDKYYVPV